MNGIGSTSPLAGGGRDLGGFGDRGGDALADLGNAGGQPGRGADAQTGRPGDTQGGNQAQGDNDAQGGGHHDDGDMGALQGGGRGNHHGWTQGVGNPHNPANQTGQGGSSQGGRGDGDWQGNNGKGAGDRVGVSSNAQTAIGGTSNAQTAIGGTSSNAQALTGKDGGLLDQVGNTLTQLGAALGNHVKPMPDNASSSSTWNQSGPDSHTGRAGGQQGSPLSNPAGSNTPQIGERTPPTQLNRGDAAPTPRGGAEQPLLPNGRGVAERVPTNTTAPQAANVSQSAQQAESARSGLPAATAQAVLGGLAAGLAASAQNAQGAAAQAQQAQAQQAAQQPVPQQASMAQGNAMAQTAGTAAQEKPQTLAQQQQAQQQNPARGDGTKELRNAQPQQLPADVKQRQDAAATDRAMARQGAEQASRTPVDARSAEMQARDKALGLRDGATDAKRGNLTENTRQTVNENTRRGELATTGSERRPAAAMASLRHALDWVGQHARGDLAGEARTDEEGATTMRVVAGLIVAAVFVGVAVAVLYALRIAFVP